MRLSAPSPADMRSQLKLVVLVVRDRKRTANYVDAIFASQRVNSMQLADAAPAFGRVD